MDRKVDRNIAYHNNILSSGIKTYTKLYAKHVESYDKQAAAFESWYMTHTASGARYASELESLIADHKKLMTMPDASKGADSVNS